MTNALTVQKYAISVASDSRGKRMSTENEDSWMSAVLSADFAPLRAVMVVSDGVGGFSRAKEASQLVVDCVVSTINAHYSPLVGVGLQEREPVDILKQAIQYAHRKLAHSSLQETPPIRMGATCVALLCFEDRIVIAHAGDSRAYRLLDDGIAEQMTADHQTGGDSYADISDRGTLASYPGQLLPSHHVAAPMEPAEITIDITEYPLSGRAERWLLCSDGLSSPIGKKRIGQELASVKTAEEAIQRLLEASRQRGAEDDATAAALFIDPLPDEKPQQDTHPEPRVSLSAPGVSTVESWVKVAVLGLGLVSVLSLCLLSYLVWGQFMLQSALYRSNVSQQRPTSGNTTAGGTTETLTIDEAKKRLRLLEDENRRLRQVIIRQALDTEVYRQQYERLK